jgi:hypothetical protein
LHASSSYGGREASSAYCTQIKLAAYLGLGALDNAAEAMLFSIDSMTTRGASGLAHAMGWKRSPAC